MTFIQSIFLLHKQNKNNCEYKVKLYLYTCIAVCEKCSFARLTSQGCSDPHQI